MDDPDAILHQSFSSPTPSVTDTCEELSSDGGNNSWFGLSDISSLARSIKETIPTAIDGFAGTIHRSAMNIMTEFSEMEREAQKGDSFEDNSEICAHEDRSDADVPVPPLPWENEVPSDENNSDVPICHQEEESLREKIMALSLDEGTFSGPFDETKDSRFYDDFCFVLDESRVMLIRRILEIDDNLKRIHAKLSGRSEIKETIFWKNYFYHCNEVREKHNQELKEEKLRKKCYDDELDAELVGRPPASCTGFYPSKPSLQVSTSDSYDPVVSSSLAEIPRTASSESFVVID